MNRVASAAWRDARRTCCSHLQLRLCSWHSLQAMPSKAAARRPIFMHRPHAFMDGGMVLMRHAW